MHITQLAYYVPDARTAAQHWAATHNAGPFFLLEHIELENVVYKGTPTTLDHTSAYGWCDGLMIELVQQNCDKASVFSNRTYGLHHCASFATDLSQELARLERAGHQTAMTASTANGVKFAFVGDDESGPFGSAPLGHYLELYEDQAAIRGFYTMVEEAAQDWNGKTPLRSI